MADIIIGIIITVSLIFAVRSAVRKHKKGGCCGNCSDCKGCR